MCKILCVLRDISFVGQVFLQENVKSEIGAVVEDEFTIFFCKKYLWLDWNSLLKITISSLYGLEMLWLIHTHIPMAKNFWNAFLLNLFKMVLDNVTYWH